MIKVTLTEIIITLPWYNELIGGDQAEVSVHSAFLRETEEQ